MKGGEKNRRSPYRFPAHTVFVREHMALWVRHGKQSVPLVWFTLWEWTGASEGLILGASIGKLCEVTGLAKNTVKTALSLLKMHGYVAVCDGPKGGIPVYQLNPKPQTPQLGAHERAKGGPRKAKRKRKARTVLAESPDCARTPAQPLG